MTARRFGFMLAVLLAAPATAEDLGKTFEMPAHRALMRVVGSADLTPFESDGCSGGLSSSWSLVAETFPDFAATYEQAPPWETCCVIHDRAYHNGGGAMDAERSWQARLQADTALDQCVRGVAERRMGEFEILYNATPDQIRAAYGTIAGAMFLAVRFGGGPCSGLPWRWGFGYPSCSVFDSIYPAPD
ncbi:MAG: hypothetical protein AAF408_09610 [Pseudomonadota bacterium]